MFEEDKLFGSDLPDVPEKFDHDSLKQYAEKMRKHAVDARAALKALHEGDASQAEIKRTVDRMSSELQALQQQGAVKTERGVLGVKDGELKRRYIDETGKLHLKTVKRRVKFAGKTFEVDQPGLLDDTTALTDWHLEVQKLAERRSLIKMFASDPSTPQTDAEAAALFFRAPSNIRAALEKAISDTAGSGAEWIPDGTFPSIYEEFKTPNGLAALFPTVNMPNATMKQPKLNAGVRPYKRTSIGNDDNPAAYTGSTPSTSDETISITDWAVRVVYDEMDAEDAVIAMEPFIRRLVVDALSDGYEDTMINGDTAATHQDAIASWNLRSRWGSSGLGGAADHRRIFLGLRALAADRSQTVDMGALQTVKGLMANLVGGLGERAASQIAIAVSPEVFYQKLLEDDNVLTLEKIGNLATLLTGQLAQISGHPIIVTRWLGADLDGTAGLYVNSSGATSGVLAFDRSAFAHYQRRGVMVEMAKDIKTGGTDVVATLRRLFKTPSGSSEAVARYGYNWLS